MGKSKEAFMQTREGSQDICEYFQWLTDLQWQQELDKQSNKKDNGKKKNRREKIKV